MATSELSPGQILELRNKKEITKLAQTHGHKLKTKTKESMKKELLQLMYPDYTVETKTIHVILDVYDVCNGKIIYKGSDGLFYDSDGHVVGS